MTTTELTQSRYQGAASGLRYFVEVAAAKAVAAWKSVQNRRSVNRLLEFDDRMLRDIGLTRGDVDWALSARMSEDPSQRLRTLRPSRSRT
jgi:uncharacterized protein YjiS (DUF1127 family)